MMYRVLKDFADLEDGGYVYHEGDKYPRNGKADLQRVMRLCSGNNKRGTPLIEEMPKEAEKTAKKRKTENK